MSLALHSRTVESAPIWNPTPPHLAAMHRSRVARAPGLKPGVRDVDYQHIDFAPTVLDLLDIPYDPAAFEGRSVLSGDPRPRKKSFSDHGKTYERAEGTELWRLR